MSLVVIGGAKASPRERQHQHAGLGDVHGSRRHAAGDARQPGNHAHTASLAEHCVGKDEASHVAVRGRYLLRLSAAQDLRRTAPDR